MSYRKEQVNLSLVIDRFVAEDGRARCEAVIQGVRCKCPFLKVLHWRDTESNPVPTCSLFPDANMAERYGKEWGFRRLHYPSYSPHTDCPLWKDQPEPTENQNGS